VADGTIEITADEVEIEIYNEKNKEVKEKVEKPVFVNFEPKMREPEWE
jgi:hypothetical protein